MRVYETRAPTGSSPRDEAQLGFEASLEEFVASAVGHAVYSTCFVHRRLLLAGIARGDGGGKKIGDSGRVRARQHLVTKAAHSRESLNGFVVLAAERVKAHKGVADPERRVPGWREP